MYLKVKQNKKQSKRGTKEFEGRRSEYIMKYQDRNDRRGGRFNMWRKFYDGWFEYYYNIETGERKFKLDPGDKLVD